MKVLASGSDLAGNNWWFPYFTAAHAYLVVFGKALAFSHSESSLADEQLDSSISYWPYSHADKSSCPNFLCVRLVKTLSYSHQYSHDGTRGRKVHFSGTSMVAENYFCSCLDNFSVPDGMLWEMATTARALQRRLPVSPTFTVCPSMNRQYFSVAEKRLLSHLFYVVVKCEMNFWELFFKMC